jgi:hypothetical protein
MSPVCGCTFIMLRRGYKRASVLAGWIIFRIRRSQILATGAGTDGGEAGGQVSWGPR